MGDMLGKGIFRRLLSRLFQNNFGQGSANRGCRGGNCRRGGLFDFNNSSENDYGDSFSSSGDKGGVKKSSGGKSKTSDAKGSAKDNAGFSKDQKEFLKLINKFRAQHGLQPLKLNKQLCKGTQSHANWMSQHRSMTHANLQNVGRNGGYRGFVNTENIAAGQRDYKQAFTSWINSPGHRRNILNPNAKDLGFASNGGYWSMNTGVS